MEVRILINCVFKIGSRPTRFFEQKKFYWGGGKVERPFYVPMALPVKRRETQWGSIEDPIQNKVSDKR